MEELVEKIRNSGKSYLAEVISENWNKIILEYAQDLYYTPPQKPLEKELEEAFREELEERGYSETDIKKVIKEITETRVMQTSPHTALVPNPRMFCIDWLSTRSLTDRPYIVGSFSGIPFSNSARPGRIGDINFVPKTHQDALVYGSPIFEKSISMFDEVKPSDTVSPKNFLHFSDWACANSEQLHRETIYKYTYYIDINKVITKYLLKILDNKDHPVSKLLFDELWRETFLKHFGTNTHLFYGKYTSKKYQKQESLYFDGYDLSGDYQEVTLSPEELRVRLKDNSLCPATIITFTILTFLNDFKCLGSFMQIEYLSEFKEKWLATGLLQDIENAQTKNLSTGQFPNWTGTARDALQDETIFPDITETTMKQLWSPMQDLFVK